jgi:hypothetical protein
MNVPNSYKITLAVIFFFMGIGLLMMLKTPGDGGEWLAGFTFLLLCLTIYKLLTRRPGQ